jgi:xylan 1,4-beta-xylosidase
MGLVHLFVPAIAFFSAPAWPNPASGRMSKLMRGILRTYPLLFAWLLIPAEAKTADNGDGTYTNPPLYADYPDPDIIRVGDDFYMVSTTFANSPGLALLKSKDLVNWTTIGNVVDRLHGNARYDMKGGTLYRNGLFAPSLRHHKGKFYVAVQPNNTGQGLQIYQTDDPEGDWELNQLDESAFDPALFFDDDGRPYVIWSGAWHPEIYLRELTPQLDGFAGERQVIHTYQGLEGTHVVKRGDFYYMFHSMPRELAMYVSRSKNLLNGWETRRSIDDASGSGHQGAIVDLPDGAWFGFAMLDRGPIGRVTNISPISWEDNWPVWGDDNRVPANAPKPIAGHPIIKHPPSIEFDAVELAPDWRWNHNPDNSRWSLRERPGYLRLRPTVSADFWNALNSLTHKGWGPTSCAVVTLDVSQLREGDRAGLGMLGKSISTLAVERVDSQNYRIVLSTGVDGESEVEPIASAPISGSEIELALQMDFDNATGRCAYRVDDQEWTVLGDKFPLMWDWRTGTFQGEQYALFCYNASESDGYVDVDSVQFVEQPQAATIFHTGGADVDITKKIAFDSFEYSGIEPTAESSETYLNPILSGFYPDPSICRVGEDYYLINSTFAYFPGIPIFHSTDLVNWKQLGHVIHRPDQLTYDGIGVSEGIFAPAITHHDGMFYVICTQVGGEGNFVVTAKDPAGPWSNAIQLRFEGIDPSLFFDDDGRAWVVNNGAPEGRPLYNGHRAIWIQEFDLKEMRMVGPRKVLVNGGIDLSKKPIWIEGPHLFKRDGWYYLSCAEGGTGPQHSQVVLRSKDVDGPYTPWNENPILTQRDLNAEVPGAVTCTGHADFVVGPDNKWWAVFLGVRPYESRYSPMGRETFLLPVSWTGDGWPRILPPGKRVPLTGKPPVEVTIKRSSEVPLNSTFIWRDDFSGEMLSPLWIMLREPKVKWWDLAPSDGRLLLTPRKEKLTGRGNPSYLGRRVQHNRFTASLVVEPPHETGISAGLAVFQNEQSHYFLLVCRDGEQCRVILERCQGNRRDAREPIEVASANVPDAERIELTIDAEQGVCSFAYTVDNGEIQVLAEDVDAKLLTSEVAGGFVGATVGPHARID